MVCQTFSKSNLHTLILNATRKASSNPWDASLWPGKELISSQFFISEHHERILIGHPSCDRLGAYTVHVNNLAPLFDQTRILPEVFNVNNITIHDVADLKRQHQQTIWCHRKLWRGIQHSHWPLCAASSTCHQEKIEKELDWMVKEGIIAPVTEPTEWVNSMTYPVKPNGDLHICLDPKDLNKAIMWQYYKPPRNHTQTEWSNCLLQAWCL